MLSVYVTLGIFLLLAARNPSANRSLIAFTAWSSFATPRLWRLQAFRNLIPRGELWGWLRSSSSCSPDVLLGELDGARVGSRCVRSHSRNVIPILKKPKRVREPCNCTFFEITRNRTSYVLRA